MAELKKYLNERGLREVWDIINGQNSLIVSKIKDIQKRTTVGLYADSTSGWAENESKFLRPAPFTFIQMQRLLMEKSLLK